MKKLTEDKIQHIFRRADHAHVKEFTTIFNKYAEVFGFTTDFQVNAFLAEIEEEVGLDLIPKHENLNYSCKALKSLFRYYKRMQIVVVMVILHLVTDGDMLVMVLFN